MDKPDRPPEGKLIADAQKRLGLSNRGAAALIPMSEGRWRQIVNGYENPRAGVYIEVTARPLTLARMAKVVGVTADQLRRVDRGDAAAELEMLTEADVQDTDDEVGHLTNAVLDHIERDPKSRARLRRILARAGQDPDPPQPEGRKTTQEDGETGGLSAG